ncbi:MAG: lytic murein transglycosylase, partial [Methylotenera sp.]|nr:lytic murein transglycosylase [Methylotenera sp.]
MRLGIRAIRIENSAQNQPAVITRAKSNKKSKKHYKKTSHQRLAVKTPSNKSPAQVETYPLNEVISRVESPVAIVLPQGWQGPAFMVFDNFHVILDWNRSVNYALSVAQLAKRLNQETRIVGGQFVEDDALTFQQMFELQAMLNDAGFDAGTPDGLPGLQT